MNSYKICIIHLNQIGDLIFSLPLLKALRDNFPDALIHSVVKPNLKGLLQDSPYVNEIFIKEDSIRLKYTLLRSIQKNHYDLLICLARSEESLLLTALSRARQKVGFSHFPWDLGLTIREDIEGHNCWYNNAKLLKRLNVPINKNDYVGLLHVEERSDNFSLPERFVVIAPGSSLRRLLKTWEEEKFAELIILLNKDLGLSPVLVGSKEDKQYNEAIAGFVKEKDTNNTVNVLDLSGKINLRTLCAVLKQASLFVGIDSGVMHLASSIDIPVVGLFGPTDPFYVGPQNRQSIVVQETDIECVPCYIKSCNHRECMKNLRVEKVFNACKHLMEQSD